MPVPVARVRGSAGQGSRVGLRAASGEGLYRTGESVESHLMRRAVRRLPVQTRAETKVAITAASYVSDYLFFYKKLVRFLFLFLRF
jgi:hypothetical protein